MIKYINMEQIFNEISRAFGYLCIAGIIYIVGKTASDKAKKGSYISVLWKGFLLCAGIALVASIALGNPSCEDYEQDPWGGICYSYSDSGFEPTTEERIARFAYFMTLLYVPVIIGAISNRKK